MVKLKGILPTCYFNALKSFHFEMKICWFVVIVVKVIDCSNFYYLIFSVKLFFYENSRKHTQNTTGTIPNCLVSKIRQTYKYLLKYVIGIINRDNYVNVIYLHRLSFCRFLFYVN